MALPSILDAARQHLFADIDKMRAAGVPPATVSHLLRLRDIYNYWVAYPSKRDRDIVAELRSRYGLGDTAAREDLKLIKVLLGDLQKPTKDYMRYRVTMMLNRAYEKADAANDSRNMVAAADKLAKVHHLHDDDERASVLDTLIPTRLVFTDDPTVIGLNRMPDFRTKIPKVKDKYFVEATEDIEFEEIDAQLDELFKPMPDYGNKNSTGLSE